MTQAPLLGCTFLWKNTGPGANESASKLRRRDIRPAGPMDGASSGPVRLARPDADPLDRPPRKALVTPSGSVRCRIVGPSVTPGRLRASWRSGLRRSPLSFEDCHPLGVASSKPVAISNGVAIFVGSGYAEWTCGQTPDPSRLQAVPVLDRRDAQALLGAIGGSSWQRPRHMAAASISLAGTGPALKTSLNHPSASRRSGAATPAWQAAWSAASASSAVIGSGASSHSTRGPSPRSSMR